MDLAFIEEDTVALPPTENNVMCSIGPANKRVLYMGCTRNMARRMQHHNRGCYTRTSFVHDRPYALVLTGFEARWLGFPAWHGKMKVHCNNITRGLQEMGEDLHHWVDGVQEWLGLHFVFHTHNAATSRTNL